MLILPRIQSYSSSGHGLVRESKLSNFVHYGLHSRPEVREEIWRGYQEHTPFNQLPTSSTLSLEYWKRRNKSGNKMQKYPALNHLFLQKSIDELFPNLQDFLCPIFLYFPLQAPIDSLRYLHQRDVFILLTTQVPSSKQDLVSPYLKESTLLRSASKL